MKVCEINADKWAYFRERETLEDAAIRKLAGPQGEKYLSICLETLALTSKTTAFLPSYLKVRPPVSKLKPLIHLFSASVINKNRWGVGNLV